MNESVLYKDVNVYIGRELVLEDISFEVEHPEFLSIMGPNGAGKTTLLKTMIGLIKPHKGVISVFGIDPSKDPLSIRKVVGYVPQKEYISRDLPVKVREVVLMGILIHKGLPRYPSPKDIEDAREALGIVEMEWAWDRRYSTLSGGEQQRVLIARGIAAKPKILLLDEPFNEVDVPTQTMIVEFLDRIKKIGVTIITVTHDINPLSLVSDEIMILNRRILAVGKPGDVLRKDILSKVYGSSVRIVDGYPCPIVVTGDSHA